MSRKHDYRTSSGSHYGPAITVWGALKCMLIETSYITSKLKVSAVKCTEICMLSKY